MNTELALWAKANKVKHALSQMLLASEGQDLDFYGYFDFETEGSEVGLFVHLDDGRTLQGSYRLGPLEEYRHDPPYMYFQGTEGFTGSEGFYADLEGFVRQEFYSKIVK